MEPEKDPITSYSLLTWGWVVFLSVWGGIVSFLGKVREGKTQMFKFTELIGEASTSGFAGVLTFLLCEAAQTDRLMSAVLVGISGHMGAKTVRIIENIFEKKLGTP